MVKASGSCKMLIQFKSIHYTLKLYAAKTRNKIQPILGTKYCQNSESKNSLKKLRPT